MHYADVIEGYADRAPDAIALVHGETRRTWAEFEDRAARLAGALQDAGLVPGSKVGLLLYNGPEYYEAFLAALKARMVPINVNYRYVDDELVYLLEDSDAEALIFHASLGETVGRFGLNTTVGLGGIVDVATPVVIRVVEFVAAPRPQ